MSLQEAADEVVQKDLSAIHGEGGVVALTPDGQLAWSFNTLGMFRAKLKEGGTPQIGMFRDEP
jgi:beta-aspartyl-peptidase (threonine type)